jgi:hypothetical protein
MLALATAAHGQDPSSILIILAAVAAAIFWRGLIKVGIALVVILFLVLLVTGTSALFQDLRLIVPLAVAACAARAGAHRTRRAGVVSRSCPPGRGG